MIPGSRRKGKCSKSPGVSAVFEEEQLSKHPSKKGISSERQHTPPTAAKQASDQEVVGVR
jgi:hypothetical protein